MVWPEEVLTQTGRGLVLWAMLVEEEVSLGLPQCLELIFRNWGVNTPIVQTVFRMHFMMWCYLHLWWYFLLMESSFRCIHLNWIDHVKWSAFMLPTVCPSWAKCKDLLQLMRPHWPNNELLLLCYQYYLYIIQLILVHKEVLHCVTLVLILHYLKLLLSCT